MDIKKLSEENPKFNLYIGPSPVKSFSITDDKTHLGKEVVLVEYEDGKTELMTKLMFDVSSSSAPISLTDLRDRRLTPIVERTLEILTEYGLKQGESPYYVSLLTTSLEMNADAATEEVWGKPKEEVSALDIDLVLRKKKDGQSK